MAGGLEIMRSEEFTLAERLVAAGYRTGCFGKWHNGENHPFDARAQGFQRFVGFNGGGVYDYFDRLYLCDAGQCSHPGYITDVITDAAIEFMRTDRGRPFLCYVAYNAPHSPYQVPDRFFEKYRKRDFDDGVAAVYGMVDCIDENVGRLLGALDGEGLARDTIVIFLSDNGPTGPARPNAGMKGRKGGADEGSTRVPCLVRWP